MKSYDGDLATMFRWHQNRQIFSFHTNELFRFIRFLLMVLEGIIAHSFTVHKCCRIKT